MKHFYQNIEGWFDFQNLYEEQVKKSQNGFHFVEIGAWLGKSTSFMAVEIINSNKKIKFDVIDTWEGSSNEINSTHSIVNTKNIYEIFLSNVNDVLPYINPIKMTSEEASKIYKNESLDFIFIDANHQYEFVLNDIKSWYPKLKIGGYIGGHDYKCGWEGVDKSVTEFFKDKTITHITNSWLYHKDL